MNAVGAPRTLRRPAVAALPVVGEPRWDLAYVAVLGLLIFQYMRVQQMFPVLSPVPFGKILYTLALVGLLISRRLPRARTQMPLAIDVLVVIFVLAHYLSAIFADYSSLALSGCIDATSWLVTYFVISRALNGTWRMRIFVFILLLLNLKLAQFSVRNYFLALGAGRSQQFLSVHGVGAGSTDFFGNAGDFGVAMCVVWPLAGSLLFGEKKLVSKALFAAGFVAFFAAILVCGSRGALLGAAMVAVVAWVSKPQKIAGALMVVVLIIGFFFALPQANKNRLASALHPESDPTASLRLDFWTAGLRMFEDHPLLGVGPRNFPPEYAFKYATTPTNPSTGNSTNWWDPHSIYIQSLSQVGALGTVPLLLIFLLYFGMNYKTRRHLRSLGLTMKNSYEMRLSRGLDLGMVGYLVSGAFITVLYYPHLWFLLGMSVALHRTALRREKSEKEAEVLLPETRRAGRAYALAARG